MMDPTISRAALYELRGDQRGLETIEIVLIAALLIVGSIIFWRFLGYGVQLRLFGLCEAIAEKGACGDPPIKPN
jgi:hypothetical protein